MPYYKITILDKQGRARTGIRYNDIPDIDLFYRKVKQKAITALKSNFEDIDVVMLSSYSRELKEHREKTKNQEQWISFPEEGNGIKRKGKSETTTIPWNERMVKTNP